MFLLVLCLVTTGCVEIVSGNATGRVSYADVVPGMPAAQGPTGLRPNVPQAKRDIQGTDGGETDKLAMDALSDIELFWKDRIPKFFGQRFTPVSVVNSYDSTEPSDRVICRSPTEGNENAFYCILDDSISWDRSFVEALDKMFPPMVIVMILAHEYGHRVQHITNLIPDFRNAPTIVKEQQADCFAGYFLRWAAEGHAPHFALNTTNGLNTLLAGMLFIRDPTMTATDDNEDEHGSGFDRVSAFEMGFAQGAEQCKKIDKHEIDERRKGLPVVLDDDSGNNGNVPIDQKNIGYVVATLTDFFKMLDPQVPTANLQGGVDPNCAGQPRDPKDKVPVFYCGSTNTITMDIPALAEIGKAVPDSHGRPYSFTGDVSAFSIIASRYALAYLKHKGRPTTGYGSALTAVCLVGAFITSTASNNAANEIRFTAGDLDKATAELVFEGYAASDSKGLIVPSAFTRINALRIGALQHQDKCVQQYR